MEIDCLGKQKRNQTLVTSENFRAYILENQITWHFIPARSPHVGGIWESAIKSTKNHLIRVAKNIHFTYEQFTTVLSQIEGVLNSRPLVPLTNDPNDFEVLTPGHFLIGRPMNALPQQDLDDIPKSRLDTYQRLQQLVQHFWNRWSQEYLHTLQQRNKWRFSKESENLMNALVLMMEDHTHPSQWKLGRITALHRGKDNLVRVVTVKTKTGLFKRSINKLCLVPIE